MNHQLHHYGNFQLWCRSWHGKGDLDITEFDISESDITEWEKSYNRIKCNGI